MKAAIVALGCPKNDIDGEIMLGQLQEQGYELTNDATDADVVIVNTCAFIKDAQEEAISRILETAALKTTGKLQKLIVSGCMAERYKDEILQEIPEVDAIIGTGSIGETGEIVTQLMGGSSISKIFCSCPDNTDYLELGRVLSEGRAFKYLKIAEGCSNACNYCIIPSLRGPYRSRELENIIKEASQLADTGAKEIILIAQDVTRYGVDIYGEKRLTTLIQELSKISGIRWIRLLYCYPELMDDALIMEMKTNPKLLNYLDLPIQHISDRMLKAMGRRGDANLIKNLLSKIQNEIPDVVLRTSLIAGFPGETDDDVAELKEFLVDSPFAHAGVFSYSREMGTAAYRMKNQIHHKTKQKRQALLSAVQQEAATRWKESRVGKVYDTMIDGVADDGIFYMGRTYAEAPDIDPLIYLTSTEPLEIGDIVPVEIVCLDGSDLIGQVTAVDTQED